MDEGEYDIYGDLEDFSLGEQVKEKSARVSDLEEKLKLAEETIAKLERRLESMSKDKTQVECNMSSLLKTAKAEISRKDKQIEVLRQEKNNMCFRRVGQRTQPRVETQSKETMTDLPFPASQKLDGDLVAYNKIEYGMKAEKKNGHVTSIDQPRRRMNPFSDRKPTARPMDSDRKDSRIDLPNDDGRHRAHGRPNRYADVPTRDDDKKHSRGDDKKHSRVDRPSKRKRSRERSPDGARERSRDYSRDRKRNDRSDGSRSSRRNRMGNNDEHDDGSRKSNANSSERSKRPRRQTELKNGEGMVPRSADRCDIKLEHEEIAKRISPKRKSREEPATSINGVAGNDGWKQNKKVFCGETVSPARIAPKNGHGQAEVTDLPTERGQVDAEEGEIAPENGHDQAEVTDLPTERGQVDAEEGEIAPENGHDQAEVTDLPTERGQVDAEEGEIVDSQEYDVRKINGTDNLEVTNRNENDGTDSKQMLLPGIEEEPSIETIIATPSIESMEHIDVGIEPKTLPTVSVKEDKPLQDSTADAMQTDTIQMPLSDEQMSVYGLIETAIVKMEEPTLLCPEQSTECDRGQKNTDPVSNDSKEEMKLDDGSQGGAQLESPSVNSINAATPPTEGYEHPQKHLEIKEKNGQEMPAAVHDIDRNSPNTSLSKSIKNVSTTSTNYQIVEEENEDIVIYVTRKKVKKPKKEKHRSSKKEKHGLPK